MPEQRIFDEAFLRRIGRLRLLSARARTAGAGGLKARLPRGGLVEVGDRRPFAEGDDLRRIDWLALARLDRLLVKEYDKEEHVHVLLLLDGSASMRLGDPPKSLVALRLLAALAVVAVTSGNPVQLLAVSAGESVRSSLRRSQEVPAFLRRLADMRFEGQGGLKVPLEQALVTLRRSHLILVISDLLGEDDLRPALVQARSLRHDVDVLQVLSPFELDPGRSPGGVYRLRDVEGGETITTRLSPGSVAAYGRRLHALLQGWEETARAHGIRHRVVSTLEPLEETVVRFLRRGGFL